MNNQKLALDLTIYELTIYSSFWKTIHKLRETAKWVIWLEQLDNEMAQWTKVFAIKLENMSSTSGPMWWWKNSYLQIVLCSPHMHTYTHSHTHTHSHTTKRNKIFSKIILKFDVYYLSLIFFLSECNKWCGNNGHMETITFFTLFLCMYISVNTGVWAHTHMCMCICAEVTV